MYVRRLQMSAALETFIMNNKGKDTSSEILSDAADKHVEQPGEGSSDGQPAGKQPSSDKEADGSDRVNSDG